jgi:O-Antigen ligase
MTLLSRGSSWVFMATVCLAVGAGLQRHPLATAVLVCIAASFPFVAARGSLFWWDLLWVTLGAALVFGYGFANVGLTGRFPIPLSDVALAVLFGRYLLFNNKWDLPRLCLAFAGALFLVACVRLFFDYRLWGSAALRDFTLYPELAFLLVGYWAMLEFGLERWRRALTWIFLAQLAYFALYPIRAHVQGISPQVGLQKSVPLLGDYSGYSPAVVSAFLFFALLRPLRCSYWIAALCLVPVAVIQQRGLYLATATAILVVVGFGKNRSGLKLRKHVVTALVLGLVAMTASASVGLSGRLNKVSPAFAIAQVKTLTGHNGPGSGSAAARTEWLHNTLHRVGSTPNGWLWGVGLGPDLAFGFQSGGVRKPHDDYLEMFARVGVIGILLFFGLLAGLLSPLISGARRLGPEAASFIWWVLGTAAAYLIVAGTQPLLAYPYGTMPLFLAGGAGLALARRRSEVDDAGWQKHRRPRPNQALAASIGEL